jgi:GTP diphosphokinase / guanosine-3',5'-bis(diphosphate) 3'-diphosphatase
MIQVADNGLADLLRGLPITPAGEGDRERLTKALLFAMEIHGDETRPSGETYVEHGVNVAYGLVDLGIDDSEAIIAAILHDSLLPHTNQTVQSLITHTSPQIAGLIQGTRMLDEHAKRASRSKPATELGLDDQGNRETLEAIRRALLSIIEGDLRIILIRMVDCLQDLRRAGKMSQAMQKEIAYEAIHIYAPLANRLGIWQLKWQLEDVAFRFLEPKKYQEIARRLDDRRELRAIKIEKAAARLRRRLQEMGLKASVTGRPKHIYSIYRKMMRKELDFDQIHDIQALRVILQPADPMAYSRMSSRARDEEDRSLCYQVLGAVHSLWQPLPREFDDYIGSPKANGYKSLHTAVIDSESGQKLEVQIRTQRMHEEAERGIAAHWAYKEQSSRMSSSSQRRVSNLRELLATLQEADNVPDGEPIVDISRLEERIHVFTPNGDVVDLPAGSTPIDFAYQIHTEVGHRCRGSRVNGKMISLDYRLKSGDKVEILTAKRGGPNRDWMNPSLGYTGSARTRSKIRQWFRQQEREQNIHQGRDVIERELKRLGLLDVYNSEDIAKALKFDDIEDFLCKVGFGDIQTVQITGAIAVLQQALRADDQELIPLLKAPQQRTKGLTVRGSSGLQTRMAGCCNPIAPEPIIGYITRGQGITIHRADCKQVEAITDRERLIEVDWGTEAETHPVPVVVKAYRRSGLIEDLVSTLRGQQINVPKTKLVTDDSITTIYMIAEVADLKQLNWLLTKLENVPNVIEARRQRWS